MRVKIKKSIISIFVILLLILLIVVVYILTKDNNQLSVVKGVWLADKTQYVYIIKYENGQPIYSNADTPFYLTLDGKEHCKLEMSDRVETGTYSFNKDNLVLKNDDGLITENCRVIDNKELHCDKYAYLYVRQ